MKLRCKIIFQDESEHTYRIPTIRIQDYTLEEIRQKHLLLFVPYVLLRLRPELKMQGKINEEELTAIVNSVIVILEDEKCAGNITDNQMKDILDLFQRASKQLFINHPKYHKEVVNMTEPKIKTLSMQMAEKDAEIARLKKNEIELAKKDKEIAEKDAEITRLKEQIAALRV